MGEDIRGYVINEIIRNVTGSPASYVTFAQSAHSVMIDNLGSSLIYFNFNGVAHPTSSGTGIVPAQSFRVFDVQIGSVSIQSSGLTSSQVQVIKLN